MKLLRCLLMVSVLCVASTVLPVPALAHGHLDQTFGKGGIVDLATGSGGVPFARLETVRVGPEGEVYFLEEPTSCGSSSCTTQVFLRRYTSEGGPDLAFGGSRVQVGTVKRTDYGKAAALAVDEAGRPVVATLDQGLVIVRRFSRDGSPDTSFGVTGATTIRCECFLDSVEARPGDGVLVLGHSNLEHLEGLLGTIWFMARLDGNGSLDPEFATGGIKWRTMEGLQAPSAELSRGGGAVLYGSACCHAWTKPFVQRLTDDGHLQPRFAAATRRSLRSLREEYAPPIPVGPAVLQRRRGQLDVFGEAERGGVLIRLRRNGTRDPRWGRRPPWGPSFEFLDAAADGFGGTFVVGSFKGRQGRFYEVIRLRPNGRFDRRFGGAELPGAYDEQGLEIYPRGRGRALVFSAGRSFCRTSCRPEPKLYGVAGARR